MKTIKSVLIGALVALLGSSAWAATTTYKGQTITYTGTASLVSGGSETTHRTIQFTSGNGTLVIPEGYQATASILVVGGGGAGIAGGGSPNRYGTSGTGGDVVQEKGISLPAGTYSVTVGAGGTAQSAAGKNSTFGGVTGFDTRTGKGATAVSGRVSERAAGADGANAGTCDFAPDPSTKYGAGGDQQPNTNGTGSDGTANTGKGGQGARGNGNAGGNGGSGVVIVRLTDIKKPVETWECADVIHLSLKDHPTEVVTNQFGAKIPYGADMSDIVDDDEVAKVIDVDGYVAITNAVRDGDAVVSFTTGGTNYTYTVMAATVEIVKTVKAASEDEPGNKSNATIRIVTHILNNPKPVTPKVLFIGTACNSHVGGNDSTMRNVIHEALGSLAKKADVDYYIMRTSNSSYKQDGYYGTVKHGDDAPSMSSLGVSNNQHSTLKYWYQLLDEVASSEDPSAKYDYIVMEFDGSRLGASHNSSHQAYDYEREEEEVERDTRVATYLKEFYDLGRVIWIVDDGTTNGVIVTEGTTTHRVYENEVLPIQASNTDRAKESSGKSGAEFITEKSFKGLMGLLNPEIYLDWDNQKSTLTKVMGSNVLPNPSGDRKDMELMIGHTIRKADGAPDDEPEHWTTYNNAENVKSLLEALVKPVPHDIELEDKVVTLGQTLDTRSMKVDTTGEFGGVRFYELDPSKTNGVAKADFIDADKEIWKGPTTKGVGYDAEASMITGGVSKITTEYWCKIEIDIMTSPTFLQDALAYKAKWEEDNPGKTWSNIEKDEETGKYIVNPNDGDAQVVLYRGNGGQRVKCSAFAKGTTVCWEMEDDEKKLVLEAQCITNVYDGAYHTLTNFCVYEEGDATKTPILDAIISNSLDKAEWSITNTADFGFVNVTNDAPVYIQAFKEGYEPSEITNATVTVTQKVVTVTLKDQTKTYGDKTAAWGVVGVAGLVPGDSLTGVPGVIVGDEPTDASDTPYPVTVGKGTLSAGDNYTIVVKKPTIKITPRPIIPDDDVLLLGGNTPEDIEEYMAGVPGGTLVAFRTEVWTNDVSEVTTAGTNIVVRFKGLTDADTAAASFEWSTTGETGPWDPIEPNFTEICASQVWCKVTCPNYISTNVTAYVYIKSRESKPDDKEAEEEDKLQPNPDPTKPTTEEQTEKVVEGIAANDNRNPGYDPTKPVWDGEGTLSGGSHGVQTDAKVNLKVTSIGNLPDAEEKKAEEHRTNEVAKAAQESGVDPESVKGRNIDVKLLYTRTYSDGTQSDPINIGGNNTEIIPFTIAVELEEDEQILKVVRYHGETRTEISAGTNPATEHFELSRDRKYVTVYAKTYSEFILLMGKKVTPPAPPKHEQEWLYPEGDGCQTIDGSKVQNYMGTIISSNAADGVVGTIEVKTSRATRNGTIKIKAAVRLRKSGKKVNYDCDNVVIDTKACSQTVNMAKACCKHGLPPRLILTFNGNSMTGGYDQDCFIDGAINVFADKKDPRRAALDPYAGTWNGVFALDGDMPGNALFSVTIQRSTGKVSSKCLMPDGLEYSWSTVAQVGANDFCVVPLAFGKSALGAIRSLGARMTFDPDASDERIRNISDWQICNKNAQVLSTVGKVGEYTFCRTAMLKGDFDTLTPVVIDAPEWLPLEADKVAFKFNAQTGKITGKMTWVVIGETGKKKTYTGKVQGYAVGSECVGNVTIGKMGTYQIVFVKPVE